MFPARPSSRTSTTAKPKNKRRIVNKKKQQSQQSSAPPKHQSSIPKTEQNKELARLIRQEIQQWDASIAAFPLSDASTASSSILSSTAPPSPSHYPYPYPETRFGVESLVSLFGTSVYSIKDKVVEDAASDRAATLKRVNNASATLHRRMVELRMLSRKANNISSSSSSKAIRRELKKVWEQSQQDLKEASECRQQSRRSSEVLQVKVFEYLKNGQMGGEREQNQEEWETSSSESDSNDGVVETHKELQNRIRSMSMASPKVLVHQAEKDNRVIRRTVRHTHAMTPPGAATPPPAKRNVAPLHIQEDATKAISWFKITCNEVATGVLLRSNARLAEAGRDAVFERGRKKAMEQVEEVKLMRRKSIALGAEVQHGNTIVSDLSREKQSLQKELNLAIRRVTSVNKTYDEKEANMKKERVKFEKESEEKDDVIKRLGVEKKLMETKRVETLTNMQMLVAEVEELKLKLLEGSKEVKVVEEVEPQQIIPIEAEHATRERAHTVNHSQIQEVLDENEKAGHASRSRVHSVELSGVAEIRKAEECSRVRTHTVEHSSAAAALLQFEEGGD
ncbi:hypothetical protein ScalyP_jg1735 [Parmales sp. scaly parma]|nr:hypothetical protein ScalyP_jg1735 [Parmales sp. scaly parma]